MVATKKTRTPAEAQASLLQPGAKSNRGRKTKFAPVDPNRDTADRPSPEELRRQIADIMKQKVRSNDPHALDQERRRQVLRDFLDRHNMSASGWSKAAGVSINVVLNFINGHAKSLTPQVYQKLAEVAAVPVTRINGDEAFAEHPDTIPVIGYIAAGDFQHQFPDFEDDELYSVTAVLPESVGVSPTRSHCFGLEVRGESMNLFYKDGSVVICLPIWAVQRDLQSGDHVVVERVDRDGSIEATVKEYVVDAEENHWLWPRSDSPKHQTPIELSAETTDEVKVSAYVVGSFNRAPNF